MGPANPGKSNAVNAGSTAQNHDETAWDWYGRNGSQQRVLEAYQPE